MYTGRALLVAARSALAGCSLGEERGEGLIWSNAETSRVAMYIYATLIC